MNFIHHPFRIFILMLVCFILLSFTLCSAEQTNTRLSNGTNQTLINQNGSGASSLSDATGTVNMTSYMESLMHFTKEQKIAFLNHRDNMAIQANYVGKSLPKANVSLLSKVPYIGADRDQGYCGSCWVWASTGALEVALAINNNVSDRLSVQYFDSNWNNGSAIGNACEGGETYQVADFYSTILKQTIPWSNTNASYADYNYSENSTSLPASYISTNPSYQLTGVVDTAINSYVDQNTTINNIKTLINSNQSVLWGFYLPDNGWKDFITFWLHQNESTVWDPDPYTNAPDGGGHEVLIVGYDDTASIPYWLALNSWGTTNTRPQGLFRLKMYMNYTATTIDDNLSSLSNSFDIFTTIYNTTNPAPAPTVTSPSSPVPASSTYRSIHQQINPRPFYQVPTAK